MAVTFDNFEGTVQVTTAGDIAVGDVTVLGNHVGVAMTTALTGKLCTYKIQGKVSGVTKVTSQAWAVGDHIYYDTGNAYFTKTALSNYFAGIAADVVGSGAVVVGNVILMGGIEPTTDYGSGGLETDVIAESTSAAGVTVDGVLVKDGGVTLAEGGNVILGTTTGTKIGTAAAQKLGFYNATAVVQPSSASSAAVTPSTSFTGTDSCAVATVLAAVQAVETLANELRAELVTLGLIKGAA